MADRPRSGGFGFLARMAGRRRRRVAAGFSPTPHLQCVLIGFAFLKLCATCVPLFRDYYVMLGALQIIEAPVVVMIQSTVRLAHKHATPTVGAEV